MTAHEQTQVWFRNPDSYIRELVECGQSLIAWDRGILQKKRIDAKKHADLYFGKTYPYRLLLVGEQGTAEIRPDSSIERPTAVYPTWGYGEDQALLEEIVSRPVGKDMKSCLDATVSADERPVWNQEHRVVINEVPNALTGPGRKFLRYLKELQEEYPECIIHVHGLYSYRMAFGMGFGASDIGPREAAQKGKIIFPSGREAKYEAAVQNPQWVTVLGFNPVDLSVPRNRCMYNIKSAVWAGENYNKLYNFRVAGDSNYVPDIESSDSEFVPATTGSALTVNVKPKPGDKQLCDTCSLASKCKHFRDGAVCTLPGADSKNLADMFGSRNADIIIDALGTLVAAGTRRLERGIKEENDFGEMSPEVTKMMGQIFGQGVQLAKLINPALGGGTKVQVNVNGGSATVATSDPKQMVAVVMRELESQGIPRDQITPEAVMGLLSSMAQPARTQQAIEGELITRDEQAS